MKLSPSLFLILELFILVPSLLFLLGLVMWIVGRNHFLYFLVVTPHVSLQNFAVLVLTPMSGGILAYGYMERYKIRGRIQRVSKLILTYSILIVGLTTAYFISTLFS